MQHGHRTVQRPARPDVRRAVEHRLRLHRRGLRDRRLPQGDGGRRGGRRLSGGLADRADVHHHQRRQRRRRIHDSIAYDGRGNHRVRRYSHRIRPRAGDDRHHGDAGAWARRVDQSASRHHHRGHRCRRCVPDRASRRAPRTPRSRTVSSPTPARNGRSRSPARRSPVRAGRRRRSTSSSTRCARTCKPRRDGHLLDRFKNYGGSPATNVVIVDDVPPGIGRSLQTVRAQRRERRGDRDASRDRSSPCGSERSASAPSTR